jgi:RTX calcium-binding nonapeptide repeat (4 copies)
MANFRKNGVNSSFSKKSNKSKSTDLNAQGTKRTTDSGDISTLIPTSNQRDDLMGMPAPVIAAPKDSAMRMPKLDSVSGFQKTSTDYKTNHKTKGGATAKINKPDTPNDDVLTGGNGKDVLSARNGSDRLSGGKGNDLLISYSDAGEPSVLGKQVVNKNEPLKNSNDILTGGAGADTFLFALEIDAKKKFLDKHTQADGRINGGGVAGENNKSHDHWLESIGNDTITDFSIEEGDKIQIKGHTVDLFATEKVGNDYVLRLRSNQGNADQNNPNGAHDGDLVGTVTLKGAAKYSEEQIKGAIEVNAGVLYVADGRGVATVEADTTTNRTAVTLAGIAQSSSGDAILGNGSMTGMNMTYSKETMGTNAAKDIKTSGSYKELMYMGVSALDGLMSSGTNDFLAMNLSDMNPKSATSDMGTMLPKADAISSTANPCGNMVCTCSGIAKINDEC